MSKKYNQPARVNTIINQDEVNNTYPKDMPIKQPEGLVHPLSLAAWLNRADKTIYLKRCCSDGRNAAIATLG